MSSTKPVVVYGASGYTGRLTCEYLREYNIPFIAAGRDANLVRQVMETKVPGIETADYEVRQVDNNVDALTDLFKGAKVVCNMVGPFMTYGPTCAEAALRAGCHYLDTTGEQDWCMLADEKFGERYAEKGLLISPSTAHQFATSDIAAHIALETPGVDSLDIISIWGGMPTKASTATIFTILMADHHYLEQNQYVKYPPAAYFEVVLPGQHQTSLVMSNWSSPHPVWHKRNPRVANCKVLGGVFNRAVMEQVVAMAKMVEEKIKPLDPDGQRAALAEVAKGVQAGMPPRENQRVNRSLDSVYATGAHKSVSVVIRGANNYKQTGLYQAWSAHNLVIGRPRAVGFASVCQAFGHREALAAQQYHGLLGEPVVGGDVAAVPAPAPATTLGRLNGAGVAPGVLQAVH
ncbi:MAG TPA: DUF5938 domain-containing protein [Candidatus Dormibacteraeota bacterium]|nr:DUF5938 domain-containing protein [Candidatus Dormibacteraeota bacterium]